MLQDTNAQDIATPLSLMVLQESVYVLAGDLIRLSIQSGQIDWQTMRVVDGERIRRTQFPRSFIQAAPVRDVDHMLLDIISHRSGKTLVARDRFGILAIDDQTGDVIWSHQPDPRN